MNQHPMKEVFNDLLTSVKELVSSDTIIGDPIEIPDGTRIIPVSKAVFGFASGGTEFDSKRQPQTSHFGGGSGAGLTVSPVCFLVIKDGDVKILQIAENVTGLERTVAQAPEIVAKLADIFKKDKDSAGQM